MRAKPKTRKYLVLGPRNVHVGAALVFADGRIITANVENASYGLSLCAETNAVAKAMSEGVRGGLLAVAVVSGAGPMLSPYGRCRQVLSELAQLGGTDPLVYCADGREVMDLPLSQLLPLAFGPTNLDEMAEGEHFRLAVLPTLTTQDGLRHLKLRISLEALSCSSQFAC